MLYGVFGISLREIPAKRKRFAQKFALANFKENRGSALALREIHEGTVAAAAVGNLEQTYGQELRQKILTGEASKEELFALAEEAYREVMMAMSEETFTDLNK